MKNVFLGSSDGDIEAANHNKVIQMPSKRDHVVSVGKDHQPSEVSFVLERNMGGGGLDNSMGNSSSSAGSKVGLFSIALVMCVCCINSFFVPLGIPTSVSTLTVGSSSSGKQASTGASGISGQNLLTIEEEVVTA